MTSQSINAAKHCQSEVCQLLLRKAVTVQLGGQLQERGEVIMSPKALVAILETGRLFKLDLVDRQFDFRGIASNGEKNTGLAASSVVA
jgi:hypothetical protein